MFSEPLIPRMFHRRLVLLFAAVTVGVIPLSIRLAQLTTAKSDQARAEADARLVKQQWTPTTRGSILDRKGRVLTQDRPGYSLAVDYRVIRGDWAARRARDFAADALSAEWRRLSDADQRRIIDALAPAYEQHLDRAWNDLARLASVDRATIDSRRADILSRIEAMRDAIHRSREEAELKSLADRGRSLTPRLEREIDARVRRPFVEELSPHAIATAVDDRTGFAATLAAEEEIEIDLPSVPIRRSSESDATTLPTTDRVPRIPGLVVKESGDRDAPFDDFTVTLDRSSLPSPVRSADPIDITVTGVAAHVLGWMSSGVQQEDISRRKQALAASDSARALAVTPEGDDRGAYREGERIGRSGIEGVLEFDLRGLRGLRSRRLDTGTENITPAVPGHDVALTIDALLQARIQAIMSPEFGLATVQPWHRRAGELGNATMPDGTPLNGAAVVLDIDSGEILAMVSMPSFSRRTLRENPSLVFDQIDSTFINRAIAKPYTPGSIVKPLILAAAAQRGNFSAGSTISCTGHLLPDRPTMLRCWVYKGFNTTHTAQLGHPLSAEEGIQVSCNIFFFTLGQRLGVEGVLAAYRDFGVGTPFRLGVGTEFPGALGSAPDASDVKSWDAVQMAIGQSKVTWTPLHAADAYATIARGGIRLPPSIIRSIASRPPARPPSSEVAAPSWAFAQALAGLDKAVNDDLGTGHHLTINEKRENIFNAPGVKVWGKTGTADAPDLVINIEDADGETDPGTATPTPNTSTNSNPQRRVIRSGDHSWFVVLVGPERENRPRYIISVVMEYSGSGGKVSGPITNQIIQALITEGYL